MGAEDEELVVSLKRKEELKASLKKKRKLDKLIGKLTRKAEQKESDRGESSGDRKKMRLKSSKKELKMLKTKEKLTGEERHPGDLKIFNWIEGDVHLKRKGKRRRVRPEKDHAGPKDKTASTLSTTNADSQGEKVS